MEKKQQIVKSNRGRYEYRLTPKFIEVTKEGKRRASQNFYTPRAVLREAIDAAVAHVGPTDTSVSSPPALNVYRENGLVQRFFVNARDQRISIGCRNFSKAESKRLARWAGAAL